MAATGPNNSPQTTKDSAEGQQQQQKEAASSSSTTAAATAVVVSNHVATKSTNDNDTKITPATPSPQCNYFSTKSSKAYTLSYKLLNSDNFQDALSTLETALQFTVEILRANNNSTSNDDSKVAAAPAGHKKCDVDDDDDEKGDDDDEMAIELHESLAPLYYLYGTTLLYSVEESDVMMAGGAAAAGGNNNQGAPVIDHEGGDEEPEMMTKHGYDEEEEDYEEAQQQQQQQAVDTTEDLQIAWENLETARSIVTKLVESFHDNLSSVVGGKSEYHPTSTTLSSFNKQQQSELLLDLAQIHTRLGDLQRGNNTSTNTSDCIADYTTALKLRLEVLGRYNKKVADSHYSLAGVCAEAISGGGEEEEEAVERFVSQLGGGSTAASGDSSSGGRQMMTENEKMEYRERSLEHYVQCAISFSGMLAIMCGEDADSLTDVMNVESASATTAAAAAASVNGTSGIHSTMLSTLRSRVSNLTPPIKSPEKESFEDIKEMLDEIQEAVDTAEEAEEGLRTLGVMKANEIKKHEAKMNGEQHVGEGGEEEEAGGGVTTIGFGSSATALAAASSSVNVFGATATSKLVAASCTPSLNPFGSTAATSSASSAQPMMVVKKKKKKVQPVLLDTDSAKRAKTE